MHCDLGYIDLEQKTLQLIDTPFGYALRRVATTSAAQRFRERIAVAEIKLSILRTRCG